jgi:uncharacterized protein
VLDSRELGRRPGASEVVSRSVPAPADLGIEVIRVPEGSEIDLRLLLESVVEGVLVSGDVDVIAVGECARCLDPLERELTVGLQDLYAYPGHGDEDTRTVVDDGLIDLEPALRDAVVLALPLAPLCRPDCPGLCSVCGERLADDPDHRHEDVDPRWAALAALRETDSTTDGRTIDDRTGTTDEASTTEASTTDVQRSAETKEN